MKNVVSSNKKSSDTDQDQQASVSVRLNQFVDDDIVSPVPPAAAGSLARSSSFKERALNVKSRQGGSRSGKTTPKEPEGETKGDPKEPKGSFSENVKRQKSLNKHGSRE